MFDVEGFVHATRVMVTAQDILVGASDYPTEEIGSQARAARDIGVGYTNLGASLMALGLPYDSEDGRAWAAAVTGILTGAAAVRSTEIAEGLGPAPLCGRGLRGLESCVPDAPRCCTCSRRGGVPTRSQPVARGPVGAGRRTHRHLMAPATPSSRLRRRREPSPS